MLLAIALKSAFAPPPLARLLVGDTEDRLDLRLQRVRRHATSRAAVPAVLALATD